MADTIQVVRVEDVKRLFSVTTEIEDGQLYAVLGDLANEFRIGEVIELTEYMEWAGDGTPILRHYRSPEEPVGATDA